jgi:outer membrane protein assembly factor BamB
VKAGIAVLAAAALVVFAAVADGAPPGGTDWPMAGFSPARTYSGPVVTGITSKNVGRLRRQQVSLPGTVDSMPIYLHDVNVAGKKRDVFFVTTTYGITLAVGAATGRILWRFTPPGYSSFAGSAQITTMTPVADPGRGALYAGAPDGRIRKLSAATGKVLWSTSITRDPTHEKLAAPLNFAHGLVIAATGGYIGDAPSYQGHVVTLRPSNGGIVGVWNSLCSDHSELIQPSTCGASDSAIWGRNAPAVDPATGDLLVSTGNGPFDGKIYWGDSVLVLSPDAKRLLKHWTPSNQNDLNNQDLDLGSTGPGLLPGGYLVQGGKDGLLRLLQLSGLAGPDSSTGGELQTVVLPGQRPMFSAPAVWNGSWVFATTEAGTEAWTFSNGQLHPAWSNGNGGTTPVVAGGLLYVEWDGVIRVYDPQTGADVADLPIGDAHWQSPIVVDGRIAAAEGDANQHKQSGVLDIYRLR